MKLAVIMSTYNGEKYIQQQLDSIYSQTLFSYVDIWIRDDGSKDYTLSILKDNQHLHSNICIVKGGNIGPALSFIDLLNQCGDYDYYAFSDQDDVWIDNKLELAVNKLKDYQNVPSVYCSNAQLVDSELNYLGRSVYKNDPKTDLFTLSCAGGILGCTMVINHSLFDVVKKCVLPHKIVMHDFFLCELCLAVDGNVFYDNVDTVLYRQHTNNTVGVANGKLSVFRDRFRTITKKSKISIADQAAEILNSYVVPLINEEYYLWLKSVSEYRKNFINRLKLAFSTKTKYASFNSSIKLRLALILGNR